MNKEHSQHYIICFQMKTKVAKGSDNFGV